MKKQISTLILTLIISCQFYAQQTSEKLNFTTRYFDAVNKWVAFPKKTTDSTYAYGFLYIDVEAGFTFDYKSVFSLKNGKLIDPDSNKPKESFTKVRLQNNTANVYIFSNEDLKDLALPKEPEWFKFYKAKDSTKVEHLTKIGYHYNHIGASHNALKPLNEAYSINPHYGNLEFELSYAYNALKRYNKAVPILLKAIEHDPSNYYFYRELGFAYCYTDRIEEAENTYRKGIDISDNDFEKSEMGVNMAQAYYKLKNREKFDEWAKITRKYAEKGSQYEKYISYFESNWEK